MSVKEQMLKAKALIQAKRYEEARKLLRQIDHPTAREWLAKLDARVPASRGKARPASARSSRLPLLVGGVLLIAVIVVGALLLPRLNQSATPGSVTIPAAGDGAATTQPVVPSETPAAQDSAEDAPAGQFAATVSSGLRVPFTVTYGLITVDLPANWSCDCAGSRGSLRPNADPSSVVNTRLMDRGFDVQFFADKPLSEALAGDLSEGDSATAQETLEAGGREVLFVTVTDEKAREEKRYYVKDSGGFVIRMTIPYYVHEPDTLHDAVLLMLGTAEAQSGPESTELSRQLLSVGVAYNSSLNRWRIADSLDAEKEHYLELPEGWTVGRGIIGLPVLELEDGTPSATALVSVPRAFFSSGDAIESVLAQFVQRDEQRAAETLQVGERMIAYGLYFDGSAETGYYLTRDSDGDITGFVVQPEVVDKAALMDSILMMAGSLETEAVDYLTLLLRAGVLPGGVNDGYEVVAPS